MSTHDIHLKYRTPKTYPTIISIMPPGVALIVTFRGSTYRCLEQIFIVPKGFEPSKFDCNQKIYGETKQGFNGDLKPEHNTTKNVFSNTPSSLICFFFVIIIIIISIISISNSIF